MENISVKFGNLDMTIAHAESRKCSTINERNDAGKYPSSDCTVEIYRSTSGHNASAYACKRGLGSGECSMPTLAMKNDMEDGLLDGGFAQVIQLEKNKSY
jgi:hypothetical protein